jgi:histidine ammonia-lyase
MLCIVCGRSAVRLTVGTEPSPLDDWRELYWGRGPVDVILAPGCHRAVQRSYDTLRSLLGTGAAIYGVSTGFGGLASKRIDAGELADLQRNLVLSHSVAVGEPLTDSIVTLAMAMKIAALAKGASGVRPVLIQTMSAMLGRRVLPVIPGQGSVGASGDLAPLAHIAAVLIGHGQATFRGRVLPGAQAMSQAGIEPLTLEPKEGLALLNGTQVSTALALAGLFETERLLGASLVAGALTVEASLGSAQPFEQAAHLLRPHPGQIRVAAALHALLTGGDFRSHGGHHRVQDPYSVRCMPQVLGACLEFVDHARRTLEIEASGVTDNPLLLPATGEVVNGGNFHAEPVAFAADMLAIALSEIGSISERRIAFLIDHSLSGLPPFLTRPTGLTSGFMSLQILAAALASENKQRTHPASVDSIPTAGNQEDIVSMATHGARRLLSMTRNVNTIVAVELLAAVEGMDHHEGLTSSSRLEEVRRLVRSEVPSMAVDWEFSRALAAAQSFLRDGRVVAAAGMDPASL